MAVFSQISPWSSAQRLAKGAASAASKAMPVLCEQPHVLVAPLIVWIAPSSLTYWMLSPKWPEASPEYLTGCERSSASSYVDGNDNTMKIPVFMRFYLKREIMVVMIMMLSTYAVATKYAP